MIELIIAHFIGDWLFQSRVMAVRKGEQSKEGWKYCFIHVLLYTSVVWFFFPGQSAWFFLSVFVPHFLIDKWSLVSFWQEYRDKEFWWSIYLRPPITFEDRVKSSLNGLRYAVEDNTVHIICLWLSYNIFVI